MLFSSFVFYFILKQINDSKKSTSLIHEEWRQEEDRREVIKSLDRSIKEIDLEKKSIESHFVSSKDVVPFLDFFEQSALKVNAETEVSSVSVPIENDSILVDLKTKGSFESLYKYITLLENAPYELEISSFVLSKENSNVLTGNIAWSLSLKIKLLSFVQ